MALVNRRVLIEYDVAGPRLWHERMVAEHVGQETYIVITPDQDVYPEDLSLLNPDIRTLRVKPSDAVLPGGVVGAEVYPIPGWGLHEIARLREQARQLAEQERRGIAGAAPVPVAPAAGGGAAPAVHRAADQPRGEEANEEPPTYPAGSLKWLAAKSIEGIRYGQEVGAVVAPLVKGGKSVHTLGGGGSIFIECVDGADVHSFMQKPAACDIRVLPVELNAMGQPERSLKDISALCIERKVRWILSGPRTARWCVAYLAVEGLGFEGHHERLRQVSKADASSWGIQEHFQVSMSLRQALLVDQVDAFNLLSIEIQFRRLQTIEFSYSEKAKEAESKAVGGRLSLEEQTTFGGVTRQYSTLMICPDLLDFVKAETEKEASLAKNLRKAREEREAARRGKKGQKAQEDP